MKDASNAGVSMKMVCTDCDGCGQITMVNCETGFCNICLSEKEIMAMNKNFICKNISDEFLESFRKVGFIEKTYEGQDGVFLAKRILCCDMPVLGKKIIDGNYVTINSFCIVELCPDGCIQVCLVGEEIDYHETYDLSSDRDAWLALAIDAGVDVNIDVKFCA